MMTPLLFNLVFKKMIRYAVERYRMELNRNMTILTYVDDSINYYTI